MRNHEDIHSSTRLGMLRNPSVFRIVLWQTCLLFTGAPCFAQTYLLSCSDGNTAIDDAGVRLWVDSAESQQRIRKRIANAAAARRLVGDDVENKPAEDAWPEATTESQPANHFRQPRLVCGA